MRPTQRLKRPLRAGDANHPIGPVAAAIGIEGINPDANVLDGCQHVIMMLERTLDLQIPAFARSEALYPCLRA